jgi:transcriptional regulator with XRE-family HTH domain
MNIETANRLLQYRKKMNLSQEELAAKIGVSRQAVSKWERAEASPDTDNLILLADIYGVSLDELLKGEKETESETQSEEPENNSENNPDSDTKNQTRFRSNTESMLTQRTAILFTLISGTESMLKIKTVQRLMSVGTESMLKKTAKQKSIQTKTEMLCMMKALKNINIQSRTAFGSTFRFG